MAAPFAGFAAYFLLTAVFFLFYYILIYPALCVFDVFLLFKDPLIACEYVYGPRRWPVDELKNPLFNALSNPLASVYFFLYAVARVYIVTESFVSLRYVPIGVYSSLDWLQVIPHI